jgi:hypothetical protein
MFSLTFASSGLVNILYHCKTINTSKTNIVNHIAQLIIWAIKGIDPNFISLFHIHSHSHSSHHEIVVAA